MVGRGDLWGLNCWEMCGFGILWLAKKELVVSDNGEEKRRVDNRHWVYILLLVCQDR